MDFTLAFRGLATALALAAPLAVLAQEDPEAVYSKVHKAVLAENWGEVLKLSTDRLRKEHESLPKDKKVLTTKVLAKILPPAYSVVEKRTSSDGKIFEMRATGVSSPSPNQPETYYGLMKLVKDDSGWKIDDFDWFNKPPANFQLAQAPEKLADPKLEKAEEELRLSEEAIAKAKAEDEALLRKKAAEDAAAERERQREARIALCVIKAVMTEEEIDLCKVAYRE
jgi:hypothetical protein